MGFMLYAAEAFDGDISKWDVSKVTTMARMFMGTKLFNGDIAAWDASSVTSMISMFQYATVFKRKLCGPAWYKVKTSQNTFLGSSGSISRDQVCESAATTHASTQYVARRPLPDRELIVHTPITTTTIVATIGNAMECRNCGTFEKSGRVSCCAPGGAWYKNCGGAGNRNVDRSWFEGVDACKRKFKADGM